MRVTFTTFSLALLVSLASVLSLTAAAEATTDQARFEELNHLSCAPILFRSPDFGSVLSPDEKWRFEFSEDSNSPRLVEVATNKVIAQLANIHRKNFLYAEWSPVGQRLAIVLDTRDRPSYLDVYSPFLRVEIIDPQQGVFAGEDKSLVAELPRTALRKPLTKHSSQLRDMAENGNIAIRRFVEVVGSHSDVFDPGKLKAVQDRGYFHRDQFRFEPGYWPRLHWRPDGLGVLVEAQLYSLHQQRLNPMYQELHSRSILISYLFASEDREIEPQRIFNFNHRKAYNYITISDWPQPAAFEASYYNQTRVIGTRVFNLLED